VIVIPSFPARRMCSNSRRALSRPRRALAPLVALAMLAFAGTGFTPTYAADPQPYRIEWASSGHGDIDSVLKATSQLEQLRTTAPTDPFGLIARTRGDVNRLQTVLESFGYYESGIAITINGLALGDAKLADTITALPKGSDARVKITPTLGPLFHVGSIEFKGTLPPGMERKLGISSGAPAVAADILAAGTALQADLQNAGYAFATVDKPVAHLVPAPQRVLNLVFSVMTGPKVKIGQIKLEGLKNVDESLITRRLLIHTDQPYDASAVERARQDLLTLGVFSTVNVRLGQAVDDQGRVPLTFAFREAKSRTVGISAAYSTDLGASAGASWSDRNLLGGAQTLAFSANAINLGGTASTGLGYDATLSYSIPDFHHRDQTLRLSVEALRQELEAYSEVGQLFSAIVSRRLSTVWTVSGGLAYEHELIGQPGATCAPPATTGATSAGPNPVCPFSETTTYEL